MTGEVVEVITATVRESLLADEAVVEAAVVVTVVRVAVEVD